MNNQKTEWTLEEAMKRLQEITDTMEKESLPLDEMMKLYKEGKELEAVCRTLLDAADQEVRILSESNQDE